METVQAYFVRIILRVARYDPAVNLYKYTPLGREEASKETSCRPAD